MKDMDISDWFINITIELYDFSKDGNLSAVSSAIQEITGVQNIRPFNQDLIRKQMLFGIRLMLLHHPRPGV
jgi:hypothetical protein